MNNKEIKWEDVEDKISSMELQKIEQYFHIKLPEDYKNCVQENNGGSPIPCIFNIGKEDGYVFNNLINIKNIINIHENLAEYLKDIIPFADDPAGNLICFDYREDKMSEPTIIFWEHEAAGNPYFQSNATKIICHSFTEFLEMLHRDIDE